MFKYVFSSLDTKLLLHNNQKFQELNTDNCFNCKFAISYFKLVYNDQVKKIKITYRIYIAYILYIVFDQQNLLLLFQHKSRANATVIIQMNAVSNIDLQPRLPKSRIQTITASVTVRSRSGDIDFKQIFDFVVTARIWQL